jgi:ribonuclease HII
MRKLHQQYPQYGFDRHKCYPTAQHRQALSIYGPSPIHRLTFKLFPEWKQAKSQIPLVTGGK